MTCLLAVAYHGTISLILLHLVSCLQRTPMARLQRGVGRLGDQHHFKMLAGTHSKHRLRRLKVQSVSDVETVIDIALSHIAGQSVRVLITLGVLDELGLHPNGMTTGQLAKALSVQRPHELERLLQASCFAGVLQSRGATTEGGAAISAALRYQLTSVGQLLVNNDLTTPSALRSLLLHWLDPVSMGQSWVHVESWVINDDAPSPLEAAVGMSLDHYYAQTRPDLLQAANSYVRYIADLEVRLVTQAFDWPALVRNNKSVLDLGGHDGTVMSAVVDAHNGKGGNMNAYSLDRPDTVAKLQPANGTVHLIGGDMFDASTFPPVDLIFMKHIVLCEFDWYDSVRILQHCHAALPVHGGQVWIAEAAIFESSTCEPAAIDTQQELRNNLAARADILMVLSGREGSPPTHQWHNLAAATGFVVQSITSTSLPTISAIIFDKQ